MNIQSCAKINWFLRVFEPRADGYHDIETLFQEIGLADDLAFSTLDELRCEIMGFPSDVPLETNLIFRAWHLLRQCKPDSVGGLRVVARKILPRGGGLGGGSSNAAAALQALNQLYRLQLAPEELECLGARLGSDVPFFIKGGCAVGRGRGGLLSEIPEVREQHLVLAFPREGMATGEAFARLDALGQRPAPAYGARDLALALQQGDQETIASMIHNDFELAVADCSWFKDAKLALEEAGVLRAFLCGSGSTLAGYVTNAQHALKIIAKGGGDCAYTYRYVTTRIR